MEPITRAIRSAPPGPGVGTPAPSFAEHLTFQAAAQPGLLALTPPAILGRFFKASVLLQGATGAVQRGGLLEPHLPQSGAPGVTTAGLLPLSSPASAAAQVSTRRS